MEACLFVCLFVCLFFLGGRGSRKMLLLFSLATFAGY